MGAHLSIFDCTESPFTSKLNYIFPHIVTTGSTWMGPWTPQSILEELRKTHIVQVSKTPYPITLKCKVIDAFHRQVHYNTALARKPYEGTWILDNILLNTMFTLGGKHITTVGDIVFTAKAWAEDSSDGDHDPGIHVSVKIREHSLDSQFLQGVELEDIEAATARAMSASLRVKMDRMCEGDMEVRPLLQQNRVLK